jgi:hypothetical protein
MKDELHHIQLEAAAAAAAAGNSSSNNASSSTWLGRIKTAVGSALGYGSSRTTAAGHRTASSTDLRLQVLCKVLFSVYGSRFPDSEDQGQVQQLIAEHMEVQEQELVRSWDTSMECSIPATLRIGAVFLSKGAVQSACACHACATRYGCMQCSGSTQNVFSWYTRTFHLTSCAYNKHFWNTLQMSWQQTCNG